MKLLKKLLQIFIIIIVTSMLLLRNSYIKGSSTFKHWIVTIPDKVEYLKIFDIAYQQFTGEIIIYAKDSSDSVYCWGTGYKDIGVTPYRDKLLKTEYIIAKKGDKVIGIFKVK